MTNQKRMYIFGNLKGGVGKSECALSLITALDSLGVDYDYGEIDEVRRLSAILGDKKEPKVSLRTSPDVVSGFAQEHLEQFMNPVVSLVESQVSVLDLGANVSGKFLEWADNSGLIFEAELANTRITFVSVTTHDSTSITPASLFIQKAFSIFKDKADYVLLYNDIAGGADGSRDAAEENKLNAINQKSSFKTVSIRNCPPTKSVLFSRGKGLSIYEVHDMIDSVKNLLVQNTDISETKFNKFVEAIDLEAHKTAPEKRLYLNQQLMHIRKWIADTHNELISELDLETLVNKENTNV